MDLLGIGNHRPGRCDKRKMRETWTILARCRQAGGTAIVRVPTLLVSLFVVVILQSSPAQAALILGTGTVNLVGGDLTDIGDNGHPEADVGFDAEFFSSDEPGFGGGERAFNVFDNLLGGGNNKWCCGAGFPQIVGARNFTSITGPIQLTSFTISSANDVPTRDPRVWRIEGSNDTTTGLNGTWTTIYDHPIAGSDWASRSQVNLYSPAHGDTFLTTDGFTAFRMVTTATGRTAGGVFQIAEIEFFGVAAQPVPEPATLAIWSLLGGIGIVAGRRRRVTNRR